jgi:hypothetical protein
MVHAMKWQAYEIKKGPIRLNKGITTNATSSQCDDEAVKRMDNLANGPGSSRQELG